MSCRVESQLGGGNEVEAYSNSPAYSQVGGKRRKRRSSRRKCGCSEQCKQCLEHKCEDCNIKCVCDEMKHKRKSKRRSSRKKTRRSRGRRTRGRRTRSRRGRRTSRKRTNRKRTSSRRRTRKNMKGGDFDFDMVKQITLRKYNLFMESKFGKKWSESELSNLIPLKDKCKELLDVILDHEEYAHKLFEKTLTIPEIQGISGHSGAMEFLKDYHCVDGGEFSIIEFMNSQGFKDAETAYKVWADDWVMGTKIKSINQSR